MVDELSALGLRHVGYGVPVELFAPFTDTIVITMKPIVGEIAKHVTTIAEAGKSNTHWLEDFNIPDKMMLDGFRWSLGLVARILMRTITEGSTSVMQAISHDDHKQITKALADAPRFDRIRWQLRVRVGTQTISPLHYALRSGSHQSARKMIADVLTIRADRQRYYYGMDELFKYQPDVAEHVCSEAPFLAMDLLEGLVWRSHKSHDGMRSVIYYLKYLVQDTEEDSTLSRALKTFINFKNAKIIQHPIMVYTTDMLWTRLVVRAFLFDRCWTGFTFVIYVLSQCALKLRSQFEFCFVQCEPESDVGVRGIKAQNRSAKYPCLIIQVLIDALHMLQLICDDKIRWLLHAETGMPRMKTIDMKSRKLLSGWT